MKKGFALAAAIALLLLVQPAVSAPLRNVPQKLVQPDGVVLECLASGDEHFNWLHDENGYVIIQNHSTGYYVYAVKVNGDLQPSNCIAGRVDPASVGLIPDIKPSPERLRQMLAASEGVMSEAPPVAAPSSGAINNIVVFIRFANESEFTNQVSTYDSMFNSTASGANSMLNYFNEISYNALSVSTTFYPAPPGATVVSYQDTVNTRGYYQPYNATTNPIGYQGGDDGTERRDREHTLVKNAVNAIASQVPAGLNLDGDSDGRVDNVCFVIDGSVTGWASLLWPHMWSLYSQTAYINGKQVYTYNFQLQNSLSVGVLCHEMMHSLGAPDLYHYSYDGMTPVGSWDIMEYDANPPQHPSAYMKYRYGHWISSIPVISTPGVYTLNPLTTSTGNCYKIASPNSLTEYYVVEYRKKSGTFENSMPGSGLLVYRINTAEDGKGNDQGPPDEVYVYRPNGTCTANGSYGSANYSSAVGRIAMNSTTNPTPFLSDCTAGGLCLSEVGSCGSTISFRLGACGTGDPYEPDNTCDLAKTILPGVPQTHGIVPANDADWLKFTLTELSSVVLETSGTSGNTRMWLYSDCGGTLVEYNDDGNGLFSRIDRLCGVDSLPAGAYYVKIDEYGNDEEIAGYTVSLTATECGWVCSTDVPKTIADLSTVYSDLPVTGTDSVTDVDVKLNITHTYDADLDVYLQHPDGTLVELFTSVGSSGDNFTNTLLDDEAATGIASGSAPFTGSYRPEGLLSALDGKPVAGTWRLKVTDHASIDVGTLQSWCLRITTGVVPTVTNVTSAMADGYYGEGAVICCQVTFSQGVCVTGTPCLELETGIVDRTACYDSGSGTNTLTFCYTVQPGDTSSDLCYKSASSLTLNGGTITDCSISNANLTLPTPGAVGSLSYNKAIVIDTTPPPTPVVADDGAFQTDTTQMHAQWTCSADTGSGICGYDYAIGTSPADPGSGYVVPWRSTANGEATEPGLSLQYGIIYYWYVKANDCAGNSGTAGTSDGIAVVQEVAGSIAAAKMLPDSSSVGLSSKALTAVLGNTLYIQDSGGTGVRAEVENMPAGLAANALVDVGGKILTNSNGERFLQQACVLDTHATRAVYPLGMNNKWLGGEDWHYDNVTGAGQQGIEDASGLNNIGLLVRAWGKVVSRASGAFASWNLDTSPGWSMQGQWAFGTPTGGGGASHGFPDPTSGYTGSSVYGVNLGGDYSVAAGGPYNLTAGPIDCSGKSGVSLRFQRWLNSDYQSFVYATVEVSNNGTSWTQIWNNGATEIKDSSWTQRDYPIGSVADGMPSVYIRWGYRIASGAWAYSGWNIDDVELSGQGSTCVVDDGAGAGVVLVYPAGVPPPAVDSYVTVTGISSCRRDGTGKLRRTVLVTNSVSYVIP